MRFEFASASRIIFGPGTLAGLGSLAREFGRRALVVTGRHPDRARRVLDLLGQAELETTLACVPHEPFTDDIIRESRRARDQQCDLVIGIGGGSALDAAKAISALLTNDGDLMDYLEVIGRARPLEHPAAPCIAIPTTAGTGSEVTRNAVLASAPHRVKASLRSPYLLPRVALVDPELTHSLPPAVTAATGMDALTQLIEPYVCSRANPLTDSLCTDGIARVSRSLERAFAGGDASAREDMALASLFGGLALANAGLGAVHGFAGPIGGMFPAPHGAICAALLAPVMETNVVALRTREPGHPALRRYDEIGRLLTGNPRADAAAGVQWVRDLVRSLGIPALRTYGIAAADVPRIVEAAQKASSMKANPILLSADELTAIVHAAL